MSVIKQLLGVEPQRKPAASGWAFPRNLAWMTKLAIVDHGQANVELALRSATTDAARFSILEKLLPHPSEGRLARNTPAPGASARFSLLVPKPITPAAPAATKPTPAAVVKVSTPAVKLFGLARVQAAFSKSLKN